MENFQPVAEEEGVLLLLPYSAGRSWDLVLGGFGPDVRAIDAGLAQTFGRCAVDPTRVALAGFSDGGSYALSLGLTNGDLFGHLMAFSPGFMAPEERVGKPRVFLSHGTQDAVLPIALSRRISRELRDWSYDVTYQEFEGPHTMVRSIVVEALRWLKR